MSMLGKMLGFGRNEHYNRAIRLYDQGQFEEAIVAFNISQETGGHDPVTDRLARFYTAEAHSDLGQAAMKRGAWDRAEVHFRQALEINPHYADLHFNLAVALRRRTLYQEALAELDVAISINPRFAKAHYHRGLTLYICDRRDEGMDAILTAVDLEPGISTDVCRKGIEAHKAANYAAALHALEMVSFTEVDDIQFHFHLADDMYRRGMLSEAITEYQKALDLNPNYADVHNHKGMAHSAVGDMESALVEFRAALTINPRYVDAWFNTGVTMRELDRMPEAADAFRKVLELDSENTLALDNLRQTESIQSDNQKKIT